MSSVHYSGRKGMSNRLEIKSKEDKALEELTAELGAAYICAEYGLTQNIDNSASYINSWLENLSKDTDYIFRASRLATEAVNFIQRYRISKELEKAA